MSKGKSSGRLETETLTWEPKETKACWACWSSHGGPDCVQGSDLLVQTYKPTKTIVTCCSDGVIPFICALAGRTVVCQRPAGGGERRVSAGLLQPSGHGDSSPLHVPGGDRQGDHPAGCTQGYEGKIRVPGITKEVNIPHMNSVSINPQSY